VAYLVDSFECHEGREGDEGEEEVAGEESGLKWRGENGGTVSFFFSARILKWDDDDGLR
jgi:hypothetical protein